MKIFVYGGSQGSVNLNKGFLNIVKKLPSKYYRNLFVIVQSNKKFISNIESQLKDLKIKYEISNFFENMNKILNDCDLVISRSGAGTINDIIYSQIPAILVPLPNSVYNHQYINAKYLENKNAAVLIEEKNLDLKISYIKFKELCENIKYRVNLIKNLQSIKVLNTNNLMLKKIIEK